MLLMNFQTGPKTFFITILGKAFRPPPVLSTAVLIPLPASLAPFFTPCPTLFAASLILFSGLNGSRSVYVRDTNVMTLRAI